MEDTLGEMEKKQVIEQLIKVLILVLMEDTLGDSCACYFRFRI